jgi:DNA-binding GntR family transcriptional regulator
MDDKVEQLRTELNKQCEAMQSIVELCKHTDDLTVSVLARADIRAIRQIAEQYTKKQSAE